MMFHKFSKLFMMALLLACLSACGNDSAEEPPTTKMPSTEEISTQAPSMSAAEILEKQVGFASLFSEDYIRQMWLDYFRDDCSQQLNFTKADITVDYTIDLPAEFEERTEWSDDMYLYVHRSSSSSLTNQTDIDEYDKYPFFVLYINSAGEQAHLLRTWHSRRDLEDYNGQWRVLEEKSLTLQDVTAYPIEDFEGKDELYDKIEEALWAYWGDDVERHRFYIPNMYPEEWYPGASREWTIETLSKEEDGVVREFLIWVRCTYGEEPTVTGHRGVTPPLATAAYPEDGRNYSSERYYRIIGMEIDKAE